VCATQVQQHAVLAGNGTPACSPMRGGALYCPDVWMGLASRSMLIGRMLEDAALRVHRFKNPGIDRLNL